jgi:hypothetical protein
MQNIRILVLLVFLIAGIRADSYQKFIDDIVRRAE